MGTLWPWFIVFNAESVVGCRLHAPESAQTGGRWEGRPVGTRKRVNLKPSKYKLVLDHNFWVRPQKSGPSQLEGLANANANKKNGTSNSGVVSTNGASCRIASGPPQRTHTIPQTIKILSVMLSDPAALVSVILCVCFNVQAKPANYVPILPPLSSFNNGVNHLLQMARIAAVAGGAGAGGVPGSAGGAGAAGALFAPPRAAKKRKRSNSRKSASKRGRRG